jgi:hypothetical protein
VRALRWVERERRRVRMWVAEAGVWEEEKRTGEGAWSCWRREWVCGWLLVGVM